MVKEFATLNELLNDVVFRTFVSKEIESIKMKREYRPIPKDGYRYKRDWYDKMKDANQFNFEYIISAIEDIWLKRSSASSDIRNAINSICLSSTEKTSYFYSVKKTKTSVLMNDAKKQQRANIILRMFSEFEAKYATSEFSPIKKLADEFEAIKEENPLAQYSIILSNAKESFKNKYQTEACYKEDNCELLISKTDEELTTDIAKYVAIASLIKEYNLNKDINSIIDRLHKQNGI